MYMPGSLVPDRVVVSNSPANERRHNRPGQRQPLQDARSTEPQRDNMLPECDSLRNVLSVRLMFRQATVQRSGRGAWKICDDGTALG